MTPTQLERLTALEVALGGIEHRLTSIENKLDQILLAQTTRDIQLELLKADTKRITWVFGLVGSSVLGYIVLALMKVI